MFCEDGHEQVLLQSLQQLTVLADRETYMISSYSMPELPQSLRKHGTLSPRVMVCLSGYAFQDLIQTKWPIGQACLISISRVFKQIVLARNCC